MHYMMGIIFYPMLAYYFLPNAYFAFDSDCAPFSAPLQYFHEYY
jgi:hypothetical protein